MHKREIQISVAGGTHARTLSLIIKTWIIAVREESMWISKQTAKRAERVCGACGYVSGDGPKGPVRGNAGIGQQCVLTGTRRRGKDWRRKGEMCLMICILGGSILGIRYKRGHYVHIFGMFADCSNSDIFDEYLYADISEELS